MKNIQWRPQRPSELPEYPGDGEDDLTMRDIQQDLLMAAEEIGEYFRGPLWLLIVDIGLFVPSYF